METKPKTTNLQEIQKRLFIKNKRGILVPFRPNPAQMYYLRKRKRRNIIVKSRQKGITKIIDADQLIDCIRKPTNAVVISHEKGATKRLFAAVRGYVENMRTKPTMSIDSASELRFPFRGSSYFIGTAGQRAFGRGDTVDRAHLSEAAFYQDLKRILDGIAEAAEFGRIDIETSPNGREQVYEMYQKAKAGLSSYTAIFIPWFIDQEYSADNMTEAEKEGLSASVQEMFAIPDEEFMLMLTEDEKRLLEMVERDWKHEGVVMTAGMLKWRRAKIWDKGDTFFQEYPEDDESCFLQSERSVFSAVTTDATKRVPLDNFEQWATEKGWSKLKKDLFRGKQLYAGLDPAEGTPTGDQHSFSVIDVDMEDSTGTVIFDMTSNEPIDTFAHKVSKIMEEFNIFLGVEKNGVGLAMVRKLRSLEVPLFEHETTAVNRPVMIAELEEAYRKENLIETYQEAENQMRDMEYNEKNRAEHKTGKHDDRVFSRAIAWQMIKRPRPGVTLL